MLYLPVGMPAVLTSNDLVGPVAQTAPDDLGGFSASPFLDPRLAGGSALPTGAVTPATLLSAANDLFYLQDRKLRGLHSLMFVDEVALIGMPDAIQLGWSLEAPPARGAVHDDRHPAGNLRLRRLRAGADATFRRSRERPDRRRHDGHRARGEFRLRRRRGFGRHV